MRVKDRKERNLASSGDRVARDSHHHGSSGVPSVRSSCVHQWWGSPPYLVVQPFIRCSGRPRVPPVPCMCFFSVLAPAGRGGGRCPDTFSTTMYPSSNSLQGWFGVAVYSLSGLSLAGLPGGRGGLQTRENHA